MTSVNHDIDQPRESTMASVNQAKLDLTTARRVTCNQIQLR